MKQIEEDNRIKLIAELLAKKRGETIAVVVDCGPAYQGKGDRYLEKIRLILPAAKLLGRNHGPGAEAETLFFRVENQ